MINSTADLAGNIANLCRICSAPGSHTIYAKIPPYLHEHPRECPRWTMPISRLLTEVTGLDSSESDGLPQKICVLCISYLKHAYTFRRQAIDNVAALLAARYLVTLQNGSAHKDKDPEEDDRTIAPVVIRPAVIRPEMNDVAMRLLTAGPDGRAAPFQKNLDKQVLMQVLNGNGNGSGRLQQRSKKQNNIEEERRQIDEAERSRFQSTPPNGLPTVNNPTNATTTSSTSGLSGFLNYREKAFEEDDVMELEVLKEHNISFNLPEDYKEKKCPSCRKRFMFDDSLEEHLKECLQFRLVKFIREVYHLLFLKENRSISPFEFIRRVVFSIRKSVEVIASYDGDAADEEEEVVEEVVDKLEIDRSFIRNLEKLRVNYNQEGVKIPSPFPSAIPTTLDDGRSSITSTSISPVPVQPAGITRCDECNVTFETLTELETHNINYHRELPPPIPGVPANVPEVNDEAMLNNFHAIATFLQQPSNIPSQKQQHQQRPDVALVRNRFLARTPDSVKSNTSEDSNGQKLKKVRCRNCRSRFSMISQLDEHMVRCKKSPRGFSPQQNRQGGGQRPRPHSAGAGRGRGAGAGGFSPAFDRAGRNLNASYFYYMEQLKDQK